MEQITFPMHFGILFSGIIAALVLAVVVGAMRFMIDTVFNLGPMWSLIACYIIGLVTYNCLGLL